LMRIQGKITQMLPLQTGLSKTGTEWRRQSIVVMEDDPSIAFPEEMVLDLFNDRIPDNLTPGQHVDVHFGIRAREYNGRWYNEVSVLKIQTHPSPSL
nr:DUF3127 domain-containing protein [Bacteroidaceae bacterium]